MRANVRHKMLRQAIARAGFKARDDILYSANRIRGVSRAREDCILCENFTQTSVLPRVNDLGIVYGKPWHADSAARISSSVSSANWGFSAL